VISATLLRAAGGKRLLKTFHGDPFAAPEDYNAGHLFRVEEVEFASFREFVETLSKLPGNKCLIRGAPLENVGDGKVTRTLHNRPDKGQVAYFCDAKRSWLVLDFDHTEVPFNLKAPRKSVKAFMRTLPKWLRDAESAFFPSANAHRSETVRGKLVVRLERAITGVQAARVAKKLGADSSVCHPVSINYFARPKFVGCEDPLMEVRGAIWNPESRGRAAFIPKSLMEAPESAENEGAERGGSLEPNDYSEETNENPRARATPRAMRLALMFRKRWLRGGRIETNAALNLFGWLLGQGWERNEIAGMLRVLDVEEPSAAKRNEHKRVLRNAMPLVGPGSFREWVGAKRWKRIDAHVNGRSELVERDEDDDGAGVDPWLNFASFTEPLPPIDWVCQGLRLAPTLGGKISILAGAPSAGKGPLGDYIAVCVALGLPLWGKLPVRQTNVGILDEEGPYLTMMRLRRICIGLGHEPSELEGRIFVLDAGALGDLRAPEALGRMKDHIKRLGWGLGLLDSYTSAMLGLGVEANSPEFASLAKLWGRLPFCCLAVAHANKVGSKNVEPRLHDVAFSGALTALTQTAGMVWHPDPDDSDWLALKCGRSPTTPFGRIDLRFAGDELDPLTLTETAPPLEDGNEGVARSMKREASKQAAMEERVERLVAIVRDNPTGLTRRAAQEAAAIAGRDWIPTYSTAVSRGLIRAAPMLSCDRYPLIIPGNPE